MPDSFADQNIFYGFIGSAVDDSKVIRWAKRNKGVLAICSKFDTHWLYAVCSHTFDVKVNYFFDLFAGRINDRYRATNFRRYPKLGVVGVELCIAWSLID